MEIVKDEKIRTTVIMDRSLVEEIDRLNPFSTRKEFLDRACKSYIMGLKRQKIDEQLSTACSQAAIEDSEVNEEWEAITLENWK
jgi:metal-responsive CopG/Arc/MetJ family transcriptional regulator